MRQTRSLYSDKQGQRGFQEDGGLDRNMATMELSPVVGIGGSMEDGASKEGATARAFGKKHVHTDLKVACQVQPQRSYRNGVFVVSEHGARAKWPVCVK